MTSQAEDGDALSAGDGPNARWGRHGPWGAPPFVLPIGIGAIQVLGTVMGRADEPGARTLDILAAVLLVAGPVALIFRRRFPVAVLAFVLVVTMSYYAAGYPRGPVFLSLIVAFIGAVLRGHRWAAVVAAVVGYAGFLLSAYVFDKAPEPGAVGAVAIAAWLVGVLAIAETIRTRREQAAQAARSRHEASRRRAGEERLRIARELHDVLAHNISLINVQAGVALHLADDLPDQARDALVAIKQASNDALGELRSVLDVLRQGGDGVPRTPTQGLRRLHELVQKTRTAGVDVTASVEGAPSELPLNVDLAAFRIIQEALTNITRHAGPSTATVRVVRGSGDLLVEVADDGLGAQAPASEGGKGLPGMRERVAALGGTFDAGPRPGGGWMVKARLPLRPKDPR